MLARVLLISAAIVVVCTTICCSNEASPSEKQTDSFLLSNIYLWRGHQHLRHGQADLAAKCFLKASDYMTKSPHVHFALAKLYLRTSLMDSFLEFTIGLKYLISDFFHQSNAASNLTLVLFIATGLSIYAALLIIVFRHAKTIWLSVLISLSPLLGSKHLNLVPIGCILAFVVMVSGRSPVGIVTWIATLGSGLSWRFASSSERRVIVSFLVFLIAFGIFLDWASRIISTQHPDSPLKVAGMADKTMIEGSQSRLNAEIRLAGDETVGHFIQGFHHLKAGRYDAAIEYFDNALKATPENPAILNNLGMALHSLGRYAEAKATFEKALQLAPREAVIHYNYSQVLNSLLYYDLAQEELSKASSLDFDLTRSLVTGRTKNLMIPMSLQTRMLWRLAMHPQNRVLRFSYHPVESGPAGIVAMALLTSLAFVLTRKAKLPARCVICGVFVPIQMTKRKRRELFCQNCDSIRRQYANDNALLESEFENRLKKLKTHNTILRILVGLVVPGSSYHMLGERFKGFMISLAMIFLLLFAVGGDSPIKTVPQLKVYSVATWSLPLLVIVYGICAWRSTLVVLRTAREG